MNCRMRDLPRRVELSKGGSMASKILIVEDNISLAEILRRILTEEGFEIITASDGQKGYSAYLLDRPDLILTDIQMPGWNGFELMRQIRRQVPGAPAIFMSGDWSRLPTAVEGEEGKFSCGLLRKPFSTDELMKPLSDFFIFRRKESVQQISASKRTHSSPAQDGVPL
jgi:DNA-binding response OmpR family regulator